MEGDNECMFCNEDGICKKPGAVYRFQDALDSIPIGGEASFFVKPSSFHKVEEIVAGIDPKFNYDAATGICTFVYKPTWTLQ